LYAKGGLGFSRYSITFPLAGSSGGDTKLSLAYGGGAQIWMSQHFGVVLDVSHVVMGLPNLGFPNQGHWDSGLTYTTALALRF